MDLENFRVSMNAAEAAPAAPTPPAGPAPLVDAKGRKLVLRDLTLLDETDVIAALPPAHAASTLLLGRALMAARVESIDGERCEVPLSPIQYRAMLQRVGKEGLAAVYSTLPQPAADGDENAPDTAALAKN